MKKLKTSRPVIVCPSAQLMHNGVPRHYLNFAYAEAIHFAGGVPLMVPANYGIQSDLLTLVKDIVSIADGLLLQGGCDIDPLMYQRHRSQDTGTSDQKRDVVEIEAVRLARQSGLPTFGICRGMQIINIAFGGTLFQDVEGHNFHHEARGYLAHDVKVVEDTKLEAIVKSERLPVNSLHHQSIQKLGNEVLVSARIPDGGVIEAIEMPDHPFMLGVQWHPEELRLEAHGELFHSFVGAARAYHLQK